MSKKSVVEFLQAVNLDSDMLEKFKVRNLAEVLFHAKNLGYEFELEELSEVLGTMETKIILDKLGEEINASSSMWPKAWGKYRMEYIIEDVFGAFSEQELEQFTK